MPTIVQSGSLITPGGDQGPSGTTNVLATTSSAGLLTQVSGNTTDYVGGDNACHALEPAVATVITQRTRGYNSIGNPNFEVDQRNVGNIVNNVASGTAVIDRWVLNKAGTMTVNCQKSGPANPTPGSSFRISNAQFLVQLGTQQTSLGTNDSLQVVQFVEGPAFRELISGPTSISLLAYSTVAPLSFSVSLRDTPATQSVVKLCTIATASTWQLFTLPNIPVWPSGNFTMNPGAVGYLMTICLAAGSSLIAPAADIWQSGNYIGAPGMSNWAANPVNTNFYLGFVQHESGPLCTSLIDKPFSQNLDECLRYFYKSYDYGVAVGAALFNGSIGFFQSGTQYVAASFRYPKIMAKVPTGTAYSPATGAINKVANVSGGSGDYAVTAFTNPGAGGFFGLTTTGLPAAAAGNSYQAQIVADTGW